MKKYCKRHNNRSDDQGVERETLKAAVYYETGRPETFRYEDVPDPEYHPRGILVQVEAQHRG